MPSSRITHPAIDLDETIADELGALSSLVRRFGTSAQLDVGLAPHSDSNVVVGFDGSLWGIFLATYDTLPHDSRVKLHLELPGGHQLELTAIVEWTRAVGCVDAAPGLGLRLVEVDRHAAKLLGRFAELREPLFHDC